MLAYCPNCLTNLDDDAEFSCRRCGMARPSGGIWPRDVYLGEMVDNGKYKVEQILGSGGFGKVYQVRHTMLQDRTFAMKVLNASMAGDQAAEGEFLQEVRILMDLDHPNIVDCYDVGRLSTGALFLRMEQIKGQGIHTAILPPTVLFNGERTARVGQQVASALAAAHRLGILHRDLKPANILLLKDDEIRVIDFGIAKVIDAQDQHLSRVIGTPDFMAPEQFTPGQAIDGRLDVYQLGAVLHTLLTGRPPYWERTADTTQRALMLTARRQEERIGQQGPCPSAQRPEIAERWPELDSLVSAMLSTEPHRRPTAQRAADLFAALLSGVSIAAEDLGSLSPQDGPPPEATPALAQNAEQPSPERPAPTLHQPTPTPPPIDATTQIVTHRVTFGAQTPRQITTPFERRVAIMSFTNGGPPEDGYLAEGLTEDLTDLVSMAPSIRVRPRGVVEALDPAVAADPTSAGQALEVAWLVEGSVRRMGDQIQIRVRLISVDEGFQQWAQRFRCTTEDMFDISDEIGAAIIGALSTEPSAQVTRASAPPNAAAVDLFLRARHSLRENWHDDTTEAVTLFDQALQAAPGDPQILAQAAVARARLAFKRGGGVNAVPEARVMAEQAAAAAPTRCEPRYALGLVHYLEGDLDSAVKCLYEALDRSRAYPEAHDLLGRLLLDRGPIDEAVKQLRRALELDPGMFNARFDVARGHALLRQWDRAGVMLVTDTEAGLTGTLSQLLRVRFAMWRRAPLPEDEVDPPENPSHEIERMVDVLCEVRRTNALSDAHRAWLLSVTEGQGNARFKTLFYQYQAEVAAYLGERDACIRAIESALVLGLSDIVWMHRCPLFDALADDARLITLRRRHPEHERHMAAGTLNLTALGGL